MKEITATDLDVLYNEFEEVYVSAFGEKLDTTRFKRHTDRMGVAAYLDTYDPVNSVAESVISSAFIFFTIGKGFKNF